MLLIKSIQKRGSMKKIPLLFLFLLSSCSTYHSKYTCKEASGIPCEMLSQVDKKVETIKHDKICCR